MNYRYSLSTVVTNKGFIISAANRKLTCTVDNEIN